MIVVLKATPSLFIALDFAIRLYYKVLILEFCGYFVSDNFRKRPAEVNTSKSEPGAKKFHTSNPGWYLKACKRSLLAALFITASIFFQRN